MSKPIEITVTGGAGSGKSAIMQIIAEALTNYNLTVTVNTVLPLRPDTGLRQVVSSIVSNKTPIEMTEKTLSIQSGVQEL